MKILQVHNSYQQHGGEDRVATLERRILTEAGHHVIPFFKCNDEIGNYRLVDKAALPVKTAWSWTIYRSLRELLRRERPDVAHFHNILPLVSPSAYYACRDAGVPVVQTLHNFRLLCVSALLYRDGKVCNECRQLGSLLNGVLRGCYRSRLTSITVAAMVSLHQCLGTWDDLVDRYIVLSNFACRIFAAAGLPNEKLTVKPNFTFDAETRIGAGQHAIFVGRLSAEKGCRTLIQGWNQLMRPIPLYVVGEGPLSTELKSSLNASASSAVTFTGWLPPADVSVLLKNARFVIVPSECYENFPLAVVEAFAAGVPVIASQIGSLAEMVEDARTGFHFAAADPVALAHVVDSAFHSGHALEMGIAARLEYERQYTPERNLQKLTSIYREVIGTFPPAQIETSVLG